MEEKEMLNEKEQELRNQIGESKYSDAAAWLARHAALQAEADRTGTNVSAIMRAIISDWIDTRERKKGAEA